MPAVTMCPSPPPLRQHPCLLLVKVPCFPLLSRTQSPPPLPGPHLCQLLGGLMTRLLVTEAKTVDETLEDDSTKREEKRTCDHSWWLVVLCAENREGGRPGGSRGALDSSGRACVKEEEVANTGTIPRSHRRSSAEPPHTVQECSEDLSSRVMLFDGSGRLSPSQFRNSSRTPAMYKLPCFVPGVTILSTAMCDLSVVVLRILSQKDQR
ncbi:uncharacterized protein LOC124966376 [Sciurus carolinensis]|uniref:uncharacterized protein LOC124966376 n=1 Tax=Sciurus carolinensis TaxID=30640 RepID=UPI001FB46AA0|nr:uncharacterized protein LOC124966376 [Sciurus carolinensis]